jgi:hypothetical protein
LHNIYIYIYIYILSTANGLPSGGSGTIHKEHQQTTKNTSHKLTPSSPIKTPSRKHNNTENTNNYRLTLIKNKHIKNKHSVKVEQYEFLMSETDALTFHNNSPFISVHSTYEYAHDIYFLPVYLFF